MISDPVIQAAGVEDSLGQQMMQGRPRNFPKDPSACKHFVIVWPQYLEHSLTLAQGRRLPKELLEGCAYLSLPLIIFLSLTLLFPPSGHNTPPMGNSPSTLLPYNPFYHLH